jgi:preprotein translocase subunit SecD
VKGQDDISTLQKYLSLDKSQQIALVLDQQVIALLPPKVLISGAGEISSKDFNLTGNPKLDAISLAALLKFGELPLNFEVVSSRQL